MGLFEEREIGDEYNAQLCGTTRHVSLKSARGLRTYHLADSE